MINKTNTNKEGLYFCNECNQPIEESDLNMEEERELKLTGSFVCSTCINNEMNAEDLINETPTEENTPEEVLSLVSKGKYKRAKK